MPRYRRKAEYVEAEQFFPERPCRFVTWDRPGHGGRPTAYTEDGVVEVLPGEWVVQPEGERSGACRRVYGPSAFAELYEEDSDESRPVPGIAEPGGRHEGRRVAYRRRPRRVKKALAGGDGV